MKEKVEQYLQEIKSFAANTQDEIENFRLKYLSKKGIVQVMFAEMRNVAPEARKEMGQLLNSLKNEAQNKFDELKEAASGTGTEAGKKVDLTLPTDFANLGSRHPLSIVRNEIASIFSRIGFKVNEGPEIEDDWHNFTALNFAAEHPARDMQDTFFIEKNPDILLRTHTSSVQVRVMQKKNLLSALFSPEGFSEMRLYRPVHIVFFTRLKVCILMKMYRLLTSNKPSIILPLNFLAPIHKSGCGRRISLSPNLRPKWMFRVLFAVVKVAKSVKIPAGLKSWVAEWWTPMYLSFVALIR